MIPPSHFWVYLQKNGNRDLEEISAPPSSQQLLFTTAKTWKQCKCPSGDEEVKKNVVYRYNGMLFRH